MAAPGSTSHAGRASKGEEGVMAVRHLVEKGMLGLTYFALAGTVAFAAAAGAQGTVPAAQVSGASIVPQGKDPYAKVFRALQDYKAPQDLRGATPPSAADVSQPRRVVCGMVVIPVKPSADPKSVVKPKPDPKIEYSIRKIPPQLCNE